MPARKKLSSTVAATAGTLDEKHFLGRLAMYTLPDEPVNGAKLVRSWSKHGLDVDDLPDARQPVHIFQSACRSIETRRSNGHDVEIKVDEALDDAQECVYQITRLVRDRANKLIEHPKAMTISFDKATSVIDVRELEDYELLRGLEEQIRKNVEKNAKTVSGQKVRNAVRDTLLKLGAQNMRRKAGGVYFVPRTWRNGAEHETLPVLEGLAGVLEDLYGDRADFHMIPLVNDEGQREMVRKHFAINASQQAQELMEKAVNRVRAGLGERGLVRNDLLANLYNDRRKLLASIDQFKELVSLEESALTANIRDLDKALSQLQDLADEGNANA